MSSMAATAAACLSYCYEPSAIGAAMFIALFGQSAALHTYQAYRARTVLLMPLTAGALFETIGYLCRLISHVEAPNISLPSYAIQYVLILISPTLFCATIYMWFELLLRTTNAENHSPIRIPRFKKIFLIADCLSFLIQLVGGALRLTTNNFRLGNRLVMTGLGEQLIFLLVFGYVAGKWHWRISRNPSIRLSAGSPSVPYVKHLIVLYVTTFLVTIRNVVRLVETLQGPGGFVVRHEIFLYVFDAAFMAILVVVVHFVHSSQLEVLRQCYDAKTMVDIVHGHQGFQRLDSELFFGGWKVCQGKRLDTARHSGAGRGLVSA